jgi:uncharacterized membrane protein
MPASLASDVSASSPANARAQRIDVVDLLRGIVMALMALDHLRDYLHAGAVQGQDPLDFQTTNLPLFLTRWITHFCAPVFIFLAGTGAFLSGTRGKTKRELSWFLLTRGAWLIALELTFIHWAGWAFQFDLHAYFGIVIWAIGWSMILLAALIHLPLWAIVAFGSVLILGHNAFDHVEPASWGPWAWLWQVLHAGGPIELGSRATLFIGYPLVPWVGVMALGYAFGHVVTRARGARRSFALRAGVGLTVAFVFLRFANHYGDPHPWGEKSTSAFTLLSFLDCHKYPPSLCYLLMTLGPALTLLALLDRQTMPAWSKPLLAFGRVPLFFYLLHLPLVHGLAVLIERLRFGATPWLFGVPFGPHEKSPPPEAGLSLPVVYAVWLLALLLLYPACRWFGELKRRRPRDRWLSYL